MIVFAYGIVLTYINFGCSWTDQQRAQAAKEGWGYRLVYSARLVSVVDLIHLLLFAFLSIDIPLC